MEAKVNAGGEGKDEREVKKKEEQKEKKEKNDRRRVPACLVLMYNSV